MMNIELSLSSNGEARPVGDFFPSDSIARSAPSACRGQARSVLGWRWFRLLAALALTTLAVRGRCAEPEPTPSPVLTAPTEPTVSPEPLPAPDNGPLAPPSPSSNGGTTETGPTPAPRAAIPATEPDATAAAEKRRDALLLQAQQAEQNAIDSFSRATFQRAETNAEALYNGIGGVPQALSPLFITPGLRNATGYKIGPFTIRPILSAGVGYGTSSARNGGGSNGFYGTLSPAFTLTLGEPETGRTLGMEYTGSLNFGDNSGGRRLYDQSLAVFGTVNFTKLNLGFGLDFAQLSGSDRDFGGANVNREIIGLTVNASYLYSPKTNFTTSLTAPIRLYGRGESSEGVESTTFANYAISPLTTVGVGFGVGTIQVQSGPSQVYEQGLLRATYLLSARLSFQGTFGVEFRDSGSNEQITPVYGLGLAYAVREGTTVSLNSERRILNSAAINGADYTDNSVSVTITQRVGDRFQATGTAGYDDSAYKGVATGVSTGRHDHQLILQGAVSGRLRDHLLLTPIFSYSKDFSNQNSFETFQASLQLSYVF